MTVGCLKAKRLSFSYFLCRMNRFVIFFCYFPSETTLLSYIKNKYRKITLKMMFWLNIHRIGMFCLMTDQNSSMVLRQMTHALH